MVSVNKYYAKKVRGKNAASCATILTGSYDVFVGLFVGGRFGCYRMLISVTCTVRTVSCSTLFSWRIQTAQDKDFFLSLLGLSVKAVRMILVSWIAVLMRNNLREMKIYFGVSAVDVG